LPSEEFVRQAESLKAPTLVIGHAMVGSSLFWMGELEDALVHMQKAASFYSPEQHRALTFLFGHEPGMYAEVYVAFTLWFLGYPDQALEHTETFLRYGLEVGHAQSKAFALSCAATIHQWRRDVPQVIRFTDEGITFSTEQGLPFWLGIMMVNHGWARAEQGDAIEGIDEMHRGLELFRSTGAELTIASSLCRVGEAYQKAGKAADGLAVLNNDPAWGADREERCWEADLCRIKGELLRDAGGDASEVEALFHRGIEIARRQKAKSLELRAITSLARWWSQRGKIAEAQQMLEEIYGWFTEGFDTADLKDAGDLLEELS
jgi:tetratricopeptide (TPR) repeat protein